MAKNQSLPARLQEKDSQGEHDLIMYEHHGKPLSCDQGLAFQTHALQMILFEPFYVRTQHYYGSLQIVSSQLAPSVGKACVLAQAVGRDSSLVISNSRLQCSSVKFHQGLCFFTSGYASQRQPHGWFQGLGRGANSPKNQGLMPQSRG